MCSKSWGVASDDDGSQEEDRALSLCGDRHQSSNHTHFSPSVPGNEAERGSKRNGAGCSGSNWPELELLSFCMPSLWSSSCSLVQAVGFLGGYSEVAVIRPASGCCTSLSSCYNILPVFLWRPPLVVPTTLPPTRPSYCTCTAACTCTAG